MKILILKTLRNFFIYLAVIIFVLTLWPIFSPQISYYFHCICDGGCESGSELDTDYQSESPFRRMLKGPAPLKLDPPNTQFAIVIEKINLTVPVVANVSVSNPQNYRDALKEGVAHAKGSAPPGEGATYMFAHSSLDFWDLGKYATVFNLLGKLNVGDRVVVFYSGKRFDYYVTNIKTIKGYNVDVFYQEHNQPTLILQTCTPPGTTWNRLIVEAVLKETEQ